MKLEIKHLSPYLPFGLKGVLTEDKNDDFYGEDWYSEDKFSAGAIWELCGHAPGDLNIPLGEGYFDGFLWRNGTTYCNFHRAVKPILRPLSDLIKVDDKKGIDLITLSRFIDNGHNHEVSNIKQWGGLIKVYTDKCDDVEDVKFSFTVDFKDVLGISIHQNPINYNTSLRVNQWLLEHQFDVFGLIEKGLAADINTLKSTIPCQK